MLHVDSFKCINHCFLKRDVQLHTCTGVHKINNKKFSSESPWEMYGPFCSPMIVYAMMIARTGKPNIKDIRKDWRHLENKPLQILIKMG